MQEIICVLDKSGSMTHVADDALHGFNQFIKDQQAIGDANLTVVWFDHEFEAERTRALSKMEPLGHWPIGGMTALHDAIGKTFAHVRARFEKEQPEKVILAIMTDGQENSSREFTQRAVADLIQHHQDKYGWTVIFLAADQDAWSTAKGLNIPRTTTFNYCSANTVGGMQVYSDAVTRART